MADAVLEPTERWFERAPYEARTQATVLALTERGVVLDRTVFYAESGGQPGDMGVLTTADERRLRVADTQYLPGKLRIGHILEDETALAPGETVALEIDWARRYRHMRLHTCLHVLCGLVDAPVTGCAIHADRARIDFDLPESGFTRDELNERLQAEIERDRPVTAQWRSGEDVAAALASARTVKAPAMTDEAVRVVTIEGLDLQPCGGTHVASTTELQGLSVGKIQKKSRHNRRISIVHTAESP